MENPIVNRGEHSTDDDFEQIIVAIDIRNSGTVGCSYYSAQEETLYLLGDLQSAGAELVDSCLYLV
jgi:DNA mismatch repair protein MSH5